MKYQVTVAGKEHQLELTRDASRPNGWSCTLDGKANEIDAVIAGNDVLSLLIGGRSYELKRESSGNESTRIALHGAKFDVEVSDPRSLRSRRAHGGAGAGAKKITAPMPGKIVRVLAPAGTAVKAGQGVIVVEAMKMQNELKSPKDGTVQKIVAAEGTPVNAGDLLAMIE